MQKNFIRGILSSVFALAILIFVGCSGSNDTGILDAKTYKLYVIKNSSNYAQEINSQIKNGIQNTASNLGNFKIQFSEVITKEEDVRNTLKQFISQEPDFILAADPSYQKLIENAAIENPKIKFAVIDSYSKEPIPNVANYCFADYDIGYLMGRIAEKMTQTKKVLFIGATEDYMTTNQVKGFTEGIANSDGNCFSQEEYLSDTAAGYDNSSYAFTLSNRYYARDFDVIAQSVGNASKGIFDAAQKNQKFAIGFNIDQTKEVGEFAKRIFYASVIKKYDIAAEFALSNFVEKEFVAGRITIGIKQDAVDYIGNEANTKVASIKVELDDVIAQFKKKE